MKRKSLILVTICLGFLTLNAFGQIKPVTKAEYVEIAKIYQATYQTSRIKTNTTKDYDSKKLLKVTKLVQEYESEQRNRWTYFETEAGVTKKTLEIIYYDKREFRRENEGDWQEINRSGGGGFGTISGTELPKLEQYAIGKGEVEGKSVRLFSFYRVYNFGIDLGFFDRLIWVTEDGRIMGERSIRSRMFPSNVVETTETTYEYNPANLKIEIPDIPKTAKRPDSKMI
jgi:hypothetical protein